MEYTVATMDGTRPMTQDEIDAHNILISSISQQIPQMLTPRQCKLQLLALGLLDEVEAIIATDRALKIWFDESLDFQRSNAFIIAVALQLGMSEEDMDNFFIEASKL